MDQPALKTGSLCVYGRFTLKQKEQQVILTSSELQNNC